MKKKNWPVLRLVSLGVFFFSLAMSSVENAEARRGTIKDARPVLELLEIAQALPAPLRPAPLTGTAGHSDDPPSPVRAAPMTGTAGHSDAPPSPVRPAPMTGTAGVMDSRFGGGFVRGPKEQKLPNIFVYAPRNTGRTTQEQPTFYWYLSQPTKLDVVITLIEDQGIQPLLETKVNPSGAGVQRFRLADYGAKLKPGIKYQWFVTVVPDQQRRSRDVIAAGTIERVPPPSGLQGASQKDLARIYAQSGVFYDALSTVSNAIEGSPRDRRLQQERSSLLEKEGLPKM